MRAATTTRRRIAFAGAVVVLCTTAGWQGAQAATPNQFGPPGGFLTHASSQGGGPLVAVVRNGSATDLVVLDGSGRVQRRIPNVATSTDDIVDAAVSPNGSVAVVKKLRNSTVAEYRLGLVIYEGTGSPRTLAPYATSVAFSPDGKSVAYTVTSPDGDGDGRGRMALRTVPVGGGTATTVWDLTYPVDEQGYPGIELGIGVRAWLGDRLVVWTGCCDSSSTTLLPANRRAPAIDSWPSTSGTPVGLTSDGGVVVRDTVWSGDGTENAPYDLTGLRYEIVRPTGAPVPLREVRVANADENWDGYDAGIARDFGVRLFSPATSAMPYAGPGTVTAYFG